MDVDAACVGKQEVRVTPSRSPILHLIPGLPLRLLRAGVGHPTPDGHGWTTTRVDYILTGPAGLRSWLRVRVWSVAVKGGVA